MVHIVKLTLRREDGARPPFFIPRKQPEGGPQVAPLPLPADRLETTGDLSVGGGGCREDDAAATIPSRKISRRQKSPLYLSRQYLCRIPRVVCHRRGIFPIRGGAAAHR